MRGSLVLIFSSSAFGRVPGIEDLIGLEAIGEARISPDGKWIAYTVAAADFDEDAYSHAPAEVLDLRDLVGLHRLIMLIAEAGR